MAKRTVRHGRKRKGQGMQKPQDDKGFFRRTVAVVVVLALLFGAFLWRLVQYQLL